MHLHYRSEEEVNQLGSRGEAAHRIGDEPKGRSLRSLYTAPLASRGNSFSCDANHEGFDP